MVLLGIEHFEQRRARIALDASADLVISRSRAATALASRASAASVAAWLMAAPSRARGELRRIADVAWTVEKTS
jgi:hypothetical protein